MLTLNETKFEELDYKKIKNEDYEQIKQYFETQQTSKVALTMKDIIYDKEQSSPHIYRVEKVVSNNFDSSWASEKETELAFQLPQLQQSRFLRIKVKRQLYAGIPAIAVFISDITKKVNQLINEKHIQERQHIAKQAENFTSTVSHEMRTPLATILFFT